MQSHCFVKDLTNETFTESVEIFLEKHADKKFLKSTHLGRKSGTTHAGNMSVNIFGLQKHGWDFK